MIVKTWRTFHGGCAKIAGEKDLQLNESRQPGIDLQQARHFLIIERGIRIMTQYKTAAEKVLEETFAHLDAVLQKNETKHDAQHKKRRKYKSSEPAARDGHLASGLNRHGQ